MRTATEDTALVWHVEPAESWPAGDLLGDEPAKLVPEFNPADLTDTERDIRESLREMGGIGDGILCFGGLRRFAPGERVDLFDVHETLVTDLCEDDGPFGEIADVLSGEDKQ
jgi:hypothetical protein